MKQQREAKDTKEAADDAEDKGDSAYRNGDYAGAAKYFKESLEYSPDDSNIRNKLGLAQDHLAAKQLAAVKESVGNGDCYDGRKGCTPGTSVVTFPSQGRPRGVASIPPDVLAKWGKTREGKQLIEKEKAMQKDLDLENAKVAEIKKKREATTDPVARGKINVDYTNAEDAKNRVQQQLYAVKIQVETKAKEFKLVE